MNKIDKELAYILCEYVNEDKADRLVFLEKIGKKIFDLETRCGFPSCFSYDEIRKDNRFSLFKRDFDVIFFFYQSEVMVHKIKSGLLSKSVKKFQRILRKKWLAFHQNKVWDI